MKDHFRKTEEPAHEKNRTAEVIKIKSGHCMAISNSQIVHTLTKLDMLNVCEDPRQKKCSHILLLIMDAFLQSVTVSDMRDRTLKHKIFPTCFLPTQCYEDCDTFRNAHISHA